MAFVPLSKPHQVAVLCSMAGAFVAEVASVEFRVPALAMWSIAIAAGATATVLSGEKFLTILRMLPAGLAISLGGVFFTDLGFQWAKAHRLDMFEMVATCLIGGIPGVMLWLVIRPKPQPAVPDHA